MDPNNLHPDLKARLDTVMNTPTNPVAPQTVAPPQAAGQTPEDILTQKQDANALRMPPGSVPQSPFQPVAPPSATPPPPPAPAQAAPLPAAPLPMANPLPIASQTLPSTAPVSQKKSPLMPVLFVIGGVLFFAGYTVMWIYIFNPSVFVK